MTDINFDFLRRESNRARRLNLTVYPDARVVVTIPRGVPESMVSRFLREYTDWVRRQLTRLERHGESVFLPAGRRDYLRNKERARTFVRATLERHRLTYDFSYSRVAIKNLYRNWGSCSAKRNLNFNYKLIHLPPHLAEYIVVHEMCHLAEMNHSSRFWALVARTVPDYKMRRKELRRYLM